MIWICISSKTTWDNLTCIIWKSFEFVYPVKPVVRRLNWYYFELICISSKTTYQMNNIKISYLWMLNILFWHWNQKVKSYNFTLPGFLEVFQNCITLRNRKSKHHIDKNQLNFLFYEFDQFLLLALALEREWLTQFLLNYLEKIFWQSRSMPIHGYNAISINLV